MLHVRKLRHREDSNLPKEVMPVEPRLLVPESCVASVAQRSTFKAGACPSVSHWKDRVLGALSEWILG